MPARRILQLGDPLLREVSTPVTDLSTAASVVADLRDTLHEFQRTHGFGRGISAIQIGVPQRIIYLEFTGICYALVNPEFDGRSAETFCLWDDCFSFPDLLVWLERHETVGLRYQDLNGAFLTLRANGALSELIQHEMDHLDGILAVDRARGRHSLRTRAEHERQLNLQNKGNAPQMPALVAAQF